MTDITIIDKFRNHARQVEVFYEFCQKHLEGITILYAKDFVRLIHLFVNESPMTDLNNKLLGIATTLDDIGDFRPFLLESMFNYLYIIASDRLAEYGAIALDPDLSIIVYYNFKNRRDNQTISLVCKEKTFLVSVIARKEGVVKFSGVLTMEPKAYFRIEEVLDFFFK